MFGIDISSPEFRFSRAKPFLLKSSLILPVLLAGSLALWPLAASAQDQSSAEPESDPYKVEREVAEHIKNSPYDNFLSFSYENDLIGDGDDEYYTSGVRAR